MAEPLDTDEIMCEHRPREGGCWNCALDGLVVEWPCPPYRLAAELAEARNVLLWLASMDDPEDAVGLSERRRVTLTEIIDRARAALAGEGTADQRRTGICADRRPDILHGSAPEVCVLDVGHKGWHHGDKGADWGTADQPEEPSR